jgi:DNA-binding transcriptional LysR family regulator
MGTAFIRRAESVQSELRRAREEIEQLKGRTTGEVSIGLSTASCMALMPTAVGNFRKRYPDAVLKISESLFQPIEAQLLDGRIDFWVGPLEPSFNSPQLNVERMFENRRLVVARKGHALAHAKSLKDLSEARWIRPTLSTRSTEGDFDAMFERLGLPEPRIVLHARSALVTLLTVATSDLLTILPPQWLEFPETANWIISLDLEEEMVAAPMCIVRRQDMPLTPLAEHLCDLMRRAGAHYAHTKSRPVS